MLNRNRSQKGFTLIELLIVVAIIGIIAAILIPNFLDSLHKGRQKRTMGDIREMATAIASYYTDQGGAAAAGQATNQVAIGDFPALNACPDDLQAVLVPTYTRHIVCADGWGYTMEYRVTIGVPPAINYMLIRAPARDNAFDGDTYDVGYFEPTDYGQDIVYADGGFVRSPRGFAGGGGT
ncbi:MAG TPA: prepilin-type N-terminal cleavage/methylation domain-containing protein [Thermoanaerobaculia bacterium]|nr:prepilin-type N-terminal cleavage/methylation domain-containing protein [Thermoanaerobaculia bacterium]